MEKKEIIKSIIKDEKLTQVKFSELIGYRSQGELSTKLTRGFTLDLMAKDWLPALGYEVVVRKKGKRHPEYVVSYNEDEE